MVQIRPEVLLIVFLALVAAGVLFSVLVLFRNVFRIGIATCTTWLTTLIAASVAPDIYFSGAVHVDLKPILSLHTEQFSLYSTGPGTAWAIAFLGAFVLMFFCFIALLAQELHAK